MNTGKKKLVAVVVIILILIAAVVIFKNSSRNIVNSNIEEIAYVNDASKFSINLPKGWTKIDESVTASSTDTWFGNQSATQEERGSSIVIRRFEREDRMNEIISQLGSDFFLDALANNMVSGINKYALVATSTENINGRTYRVYKGTYEGLGSSRQATQYIYLNLRDDAYYMIGIDIYTDALPKLEAPIMESIKTFKVL
jgi:hypothetical protein